MRAAYLCGLWVLRALRTWTGYITVVRIVPVPVVPEPARIGWASGTVASAARESHHRYTVTAVTYVERLLYSDWTLVPVPVPVYIHP